VTKRLDYIKGEKGRVEGQIKALQEKAAGRQQEVRLFWNGLGRTAGCMAVLRA